jgi:hypothetical protein
MAWGNPYFGGKKAPTNGGYIEIYSNERAFAAAPPEYALPHPLIEPSVLRAAKALVVE